MARKNAYITPELLVWARERIKMPLELAAQMTGVTKQVFQDWEKGIKLPTINQAKKFSQKVKIPYSWLFLAKPPLKYKLPTNTDYRTFDNYLLDENPMELQYLMADIAMRRDAMIELYAEMNIRLPVFEQYFDEKTIDNTIIAQTIRQLLGITLEQQDRFKNSSEAFNYYQEALSNIGILVFQSSKISNNIMRGMSIFNTVFPIIVVNRKDEFNARIFTLMHEFVHILTRTPGICDYLDIHSNNHYSIEIKCNRIAAEVLVPNQALLSNKYWIQIQNNGWDDGIIYKISRFFTVSREVIVGRLLTLGKIEYELYNNKLKQYSAEYEQHVASKVKSNGFLPKSSDVCLQVGKLYARTIMNAYSQEIITPSDASYFLGGLRLQHFDKVERWCFS